MLDITPKVYEKRLVIARELICSVLFYILDVRSECNIRGHRVEKGWKTTEKVYSQEIQALQRTQCIFSNKSNLVEIHRPKNIYSNKVKLYSLKPNNFRTNSTEFSYSNYWHIHSATEYTKMDITKFTHAQHSK